MGRRVDPWRKVPGSFFWRRIFFGTATAKIRSRPVIGMIGQQRRGPVQLLGGDQPHQMCGSVSGPSDQRSSARASTSGAWPSGPPISSARSRPCPRQCSSRCASCCDDHGWPRPSSAITVACLGNAASTRAPSSAAARAGSRPLPRRPGSISTSSSGNQCERRFWYSPNPSAIQEGARSPTAINFAFIAACQPCVSAYRRCW